MGDLKGWGGEAAPSLQIAQLACRGEKAGLEGRATGDRPRARRRRNIRGHRPRRRRL